MSCFCFRIRKRYFDAIVSGEKTVEYRRDIPFWQTRIKNMFLDDERISDLVNNGSLFNLIDLKGQYVIAVFICGKRVHRKEIVKISRIKTPLYFSDQGKKDVDTKTCFAFFLGVAIE